MNFTPVDNSGRVDGFCLVKSVEQKTSSKGDTYLDFMLGDSTGEINGKLWRYSPAEHGEYKNNDIVKVRGTISQYNGTDQLRIERIRTANDNDGVDVSDFVKTADYSSEEMYNVLVSLAENFNDADLKKIVTAILSDNRNALLYWPAAYKLHHAVRGGLLMHTLSIVRLAQGVCKIYPFVDEELLLAGAILHDISKLDEFVVSDTGIAEGYSTEGNLLGHLAMGAVKIDRYAEKLGIDRKTAVLLEHMVLSHHGQPEFGAAVRPMTIEAEILSQLDLLDAEIYAMKQALESTASQDFTQRLWSLDNRKLFRHDRADLDKKTELL